MSASNTFKVAKYELDTDREPTKPLNQTQEFTRKSVFSIMSVKRDTYEIQSKKSSDYIHFDVYKNNKLDFRYEYPVLLKTGFQEAMAGHLSSLKEQLRTRERQKAPPLLRQFGLSRTVRKMTRVSIGKSPDKTVELVRESDTRHSDIRLERKDGSFTRFFRAQSGALAEHHDYMYAFCEFINLQKAHVEGAKNAKAVNQAHKELTELFLKYETTASGAGAGAGAGRKPTTTAMPGNKRSLDSDSDPASDPGSDSDEEWVPEGVLKKRKKAQRALSARIFGDIVRDSGSRKQISETPSVPVAGPG